MMGSRDRRGQSTDPNTPVVVNVHKTSTGDLNRMKSPTGNTITVALVGTIVGLIIGVVGFFSTYIFVTKSELAAHKSEREKAVHMLDTSQRLTESTVRQLSDEVKAVKKEQQELNVGQRVTNENLRRILRRSGIEPANRREIKLEMEDGDDERPE